MCNLSKRVQQLEEVSAHQEHLLHQLNEVVISLRTEHDALKVRMTAEIERLTQAISETRSDTLDPDEQPPHY